MSQGKQSFLGGAALLTVTMLITTAIGALYKIPGKPAGRAGHELFLCRVQYL